mgnify:CR=1 FL=1|jgi:hypothetical protein
MTSENQAAQSSLPGPVTEFGAKMVEVGTFVFWGGLAVVVVGACIDAVNRAFDADDDPIISPPVDEPAS